METNDHNRAMTAIMSAPTDETGLEIVRSGASVRFVLNRPHVRNAISDAMRQRIADAVPDIARDANVYAVVLRSDVPLVFSAGGDVRELAGVQASDPAGARGLMRRKYAAHWLLECFSKPTASLIDGMVIGAGVALSIYATHRVAGENYQFAMPETALGFFPDDGLCWVFARLPDHVGMYLGLTGRRIGRADAFRLGLVTHCLPAQQFGEVEAALADADPIDPLLDARHQDPGHGELDDLRETIAACFGADSVQEVFARLEAIVQSGGAAGAWCAGVLADLNARSPLALAVTFRHIRESVARDLRQTLTADYRLACHLLNGADFREGVRTIFIDKGQTPNWSPSRLAGVDAAMVERIFAINAVDDQFVLPTREEMQAARV